MTHISNPQIIPNQNSVFNQPVIFQHQCPSSQIPNASLFHQILQYNQQNIPESNMHPEFQQAKNSILNPEGFFQPQFLCPSNQIPITSPPPQNLQHNQQAYPMSHVSIDFLNSNSAITKDFLPFFVNLASYLDHLMKILFLLHMLNLQFH
jgi:hypothetical protein